MVIGDASAPGTVGALQQPVPGLVTPGVVGQLQAVEIEVHHRVHPLEPAASTGGVQQEQGRPLEHAADLALVAAELVDDLLVDRLVGALDQPGVGKVLSAASPLAFSGSGRSTAVAPALGGLGAPFRVHRRARPAG